MALVPHHLLIGDVESAAVAGATGVSGQLGGAEEAAPTEAEAPPETSWSRIKGSVRRKGPAAAG